MGRSRAIVEEERPDGAFLHPRTREAGLFGAQDSRASINFRALSQLIKA
jgi:hypothetical protein